MKDVRFETLVDNEEKVFTGEQIIEELKSIVRGHTYYKEENGVFSYKMYADYNDGLSDRNIKEIAEAEDKWGAFYDTLSETEMDWRGYEEGELLSIIDRNWNEEVYGDYAEYEDFIREWVFHSGDIEILFPYDHFLKEEVQVNLVVNTGDGNYDYTLNNFLSYNASEDEHKEIEEESSILWLVKQQGYAEGDLIKQIEEGTESKFLQSVEIELANCTSHMNALTFFVSMRLEDFLELEKTEKIRLASGSRVGLMDYWSGAGSLLDIALEKPMELDMKLIEPHIDGARGYGVDQVYGMSSDFWTDTIKGLLVDGEWKEIN